MKPYIGESLTEIVSGLMAIPSSKEDDWKQRAAAVWEHAAETDDLSLLRDARDADKINVEFDRVISNDPWFSKAGIEPVGAAACYGVAKMLVKLGYEKRQAVMLAFAKHLRGLN